MVEGEARPASLHPTVEKEHHINICDCRTHPGVAAAAGDRVRSRKGDDGELGPGWTRVSEALN